MQNSKISRQNTIRSTPVSNDAIFKSINRVSQTVQSVFPVYPNCLRKHNNAHHRKTNNVLGFTRNLNELNNYYRTDVGFTHIEKTRTHVPSEGCYEILFRSVVFDRGNRLIE